MISYKRTGNPDRQKLWQFKKAETFFPVDDLIPGDKLEIEVTPEFVVNVIKGIATQTTIEPRSPENKEIQVGNLRSGSFVEDQESNTFSVNFTWESPSFKHSIVHSYTMSYEFDGYSREQISCSPGLVRDTDRSGCSKSGVVS
ncbi:uncharacterized protein LOC110065363 [Orbicella faveolata]|uniref:uncharacterized protein LOC110065363 n=1 Tax=Orbicella faveolata TaxID=48498 RepID=UPI0009E316EC|nr:uncharacterized protein LOC110065363 [Orbicella faveolata]